MFGERWDTTRDETEQFKLAIMKTYSVYFILIRKYCSFPVLKGEQFDFDAVCKIQYMMY